MFFSLHDMAEVFSTKVMASYYMDTVKCKRDVQQESQST